MKSCLVIIILLTLSAIQAVGQQVYSQKEPLAHTYSIVARDSVTGQMAVAVQSHWFSVGSLVSWGKSGVGVIATQSFVDPSYGPKGIGLMESGKSAMEALNELLSQDDGVPVRQVAMVDKFGRVSAHTGNACIPFANHIIGSGFSVQANMMLTDAVPLAMANAYERNINLPFAERVVSALLAAQDAGGDIRGKQSAALIVVAAEPRDAWNDKIIDLRIEDHPEPIKELVRLLKVHRAYAHMNQGDLAVENGNMTKAMMQYSKAEKLMPENLEMKFWKAVTMANNDNIQGAVQVLVHVFSDPVYGMNWKKLLARLPEVGLLTVTEEDLELLKNAKRD